MNLLATPDHQLLLLKAAARVPRPVWWPLAQLVSLGLAARPPRPLRQWALNYQVVTGLPAGFHERRSAQFSWLRNTIGSLQLGRWSERRILNTVRLDRAVRTRVQRLHAERGLVIALPHMGSWDLVGAFACLIGLPVTSVAEKLPAGQFEYFRELRAELGFEIRPHDQPNLVPTLCDDLRRGRVVCLIADRDFGRRGLPVRWPTPQGGLELTLPAGPVVIAQQTGAALVGAATTFEHNRLQVVVGDEIPQRAGREGAERMAQQLADYFAAQISAKPTDWHMMQKFFPGVVA